MRLNLGSKPPSHPQQKPLQSMLNALTFLPMRVDDHVRGMNPWTQCGEREIKKVNSLPPSNQDKIVTWRLAK